MNYQEPPAVIQQQDNRAHIQAIVTIVRDNLLAEATTPEEVQRVLDFSRILQSSSTFGQVFSNAMNYVNTNGPVLKGDESDDEVDR